MIPNLRERMDQAVLKSQRQSPVHVLTASRIGHPCERHLYYWRTDWDKALLPDVGLLRVFHLGNLYEDVAIRELKAAGLEIGNQQRDFAIKGRNGRPLLTGHIDGIARDGEVSLPFEIKSMGHEWGKIGTVEDMTRSTKPWTRGYPAQLQTYLLGMEKEEGFWVLVNKITGEPKIVPCRLDLEYSEGLLQKAERVEAAVSASTPPERSLDDSVCARCPFRSLCLPDRNFGDGVEILDDSEIEAMLKKRTETAKAATEYDEADSAIKEWAKAKGPGQRNIGRWLLTTKPTKTGVKTTIVSLGEA